MKKQLLHLLLFWAFGASAAPGAASSSLDFDFELVNGVEGNIYIKEVSDGSSDGDPALRLFRALCVGEVVREGISYKTLYSRDNSLEINCKAIEDEGKAKCKISIRGSDHTVVDMQKNKIGYKPIDADDYAWLKAQLSCTPKSKILTMEQGDRDATHRMRLLIDVENEKDPIRFVAEKL